MGRTAGMALAVHGAEAPGLGPLLIQLHVSTAGLVHTTRPEASGK
jgi:hypothetical protein